MSSSVCTQLHEMAVTLVEASALGDDAEDATKGAAKGGEEAEMTRGAGIRRVATATRDMGDVTSDFLYVALSGWPEAQVQLKSLHMALAERV